MKITKIETFKYSVNWIGWLFVKIETDEGLYGWGEGSLHGALESVETAIHEFSGGLINHDPSGPERHWHRLTNAWRWRGGAVFSTAISALDIALWDLEGKRLGVPVHRLLGGAHRQKLRAYASHWLTGVKTPDGASEGAREALRRGFTAFKWSPLNFESLRENESTALSRAGEMMAAAREGAGPDTEIFIECSELLSPRTAPMLAEILAPYRPGWIEEPIPFENAKAMARLQREVKVPVACGERLLSRFEFRELMERGGCKVVQPDIMHAGGFTELKRIASLADTYFIPVAPHNPGGPICLAASVHLAAAIPNFLILEQIEPDREIRDRTGIPGIELKDGYFIVPETPGLGVEPNIEALEELFFRPLKKGERAGSLYR